MRPAAGGRRAVADADADAGAAGNLQVTLTLADNTPSLPAAVGVTVTGAGGTGSPL